MNQYTKKKDEQEKQGDVLSGSTMFNTNQNSQIKISQEKQIGVLNGKIMDKVMKMMTAKDKGCCKCTGCVEFNTLVAHCITNIHEKTREFVYIPLEVTQLECLRNKKEQEKRIVTQGDCDKCLLEETFVWMAKVGAGGKEIERRNKPLDDKTHSDPQTVGRKALQSFIEYQCNILSIGSSIGDWNKKLAKCCGECSECIKFATAKNTYFAKLENRMRTLIETPFNDQYECSQGENNAVKKEYDEFINQSDNIVGKVVDQLFCCASRTIAGDLVKQKFNSIVDKRYVNYNQVVSPDTQSSSKQYPDMQHARPRDPQLEMNQQPGPSNNADDRLSPEPEEIELTDI